MNFVRETIRYQVFDSPRPALTYKDVKFTSSFYKKIMQPNEACTTPPTPTSAPSRSPAAS